MERLLVAVLALIGVAACARTATQNEVDTDFVVHAASVGRLELQLAADALSRAGSEDVREFAYAMIEDHRRAYRGLERAANKADLDLPDDLIGEHQDAYMRLAGLRGDDFDRAYLQAVIEDQERAVTAFRAEVASSQSGVGQWAADALPTLERQLAEAHQLTEHTLRFAEVPPER